MNYDTSVHPYLWYPDEREDTELWVIRQLYSIYKKKKKKGSIALFFVYCLYDNFSRGTECICNSWCIMYIYMCANKGNG